MRARTDALLRHHFIHLMLPVVLLRSCFTYETSVGIDVFNGLVDLLFVIDLALNFRTAYATWPYRKVTPHTAQL